MAMPQGAFAEYIAVKESMTVAKPKSVDHIHAAAIASASLQFELQLLRKNRTLPCGGSCVVVARAPIKRKWEAE